MLRECPADSMTEYKLPSHSHSLTTILLFIVLFATLAHSLRLGPTVSGSQLADWGSHSRNKNPQLLSFRQYRIRFPKRRDGRDAGRVRDATCPTRDSSGCFAFTESSRKRGCCSFGLLKYCSKTWNYWRYMYNEHQPEHTCIKTPNHRPRNHPKSGRRRPSDYSQSTTRE